MRSGERQLRAGPQANAAYTAGRNFRSGFHTTRGLCGGLEGPLTRGQVRCCDRAHASYPQMCLRAQPLSALSSCRPPPCSSLLLLLAQALPSVVPRWRLPFPSPAFSRLRCPAFTPAPPRPCSATFMHACLRWTCIWWMRCWRWCR